MRWNIGSKVLPALLFLAALGGEARLLAQPPTQPPEARLATSDDRKGPRFLLASTGGAHPSAIDASPIDASQVPMLRQPISVHLENVTLEEALDAISTQSGLSLTYSRAVVPTDARVSLHAADLSLAAALTEVLSGAPVDVLVSTRGHAALMPQPPAPAQRPIPTGTLTGRVTQGGEAVAGVNVTANSPSLEEPRVVTTDDQGAYQLPDLPAGTYTLRFELDGLVPVTEEVAVSPDESPTLDVQMTLHEVREEVVVTGSRIRRAEVEGPSPVIFVTREEIERSGRTTTTDVLARLPQNFARPEGGRFSENAVNLRGFGEDNTLVLVNGRRVTLSGAGDSNDTTFVDLNSVPLEAVERIEVLTDGASAIYGSDAVAGVVNVILKEDYDGAEVNLYAGFPVEGGGAERRATFSKGWAGSNIRGLLSGELFDRNALNSNDRSVSRSADQRPRGGRDFRTDPRSGSPGNVFSLDSQNLPGLDAPSAGIPADQDGRGLTPADFAATAGRLNLGNSQGGSDLTGASERWALNGRIGGDFRSGLRWFAEAGATRTRQDVASSSPSISVVVPAENPFNPFGVPVRVQGLFGELPGGQENDTENYRASIGLEGPRDTRWHWQTSQGYSRDELAVVTPNPGLLSADELLSRTDPDTALNMFGDGPGANSPQVLAELASLMSEQGTFLLFDGVSDVLVWNGEIEGRAFRWAEREVRAALGAEYRDESFDGSTRVPPLSFLRPSSGDRELAAVFVELHVPLFSPEHRVPAVRTLELQLAGRFETYSDFGDTFNPKVALRWQPIERFALRGSWGTGFRAPSLPELFSLQTTQPRPVQVLDPRRNGEVADVVLLLGGNPALEPEESKSWNLGLIWDVPRIPGLSLTLDRYRLHQDNQIVATPFIFFSGLTPETEALFPARFQRAEPTPEDVAAGLPGRLLEIDASSIGFAEGSVRGVDLGLNYLRTTRAGRFDVRLNGAYIDSLTERLTPIAEEEERVGLTGRPPRFRGIASLFWSRGPWEIGLTERYIGRFRNTGAQLNQFIDAAFETDLQLTYAWPAQSGWLAGARLTLGADNLFNAEPPFQDTTFGFDGRLISPRQSFPYLRLTKAFGGR